jgi:hypothetical protein
MKTAFLLVFAAWLISLVIFLVWVIGRVIHRSEPDPEENLVDQDYIDRVVNGYIKNRNFLTELENRKYDKLLHDFNDSCDFEVKK